MFPDKDILTWDEVKDIHRRGHEITSHGVRHVDLPNCSQEELEVELNGSYNIFEDYDIPVSSYTCAFNSWTPNVEKLSRQNYTSFRAGVGVNKLPLKDRKYYVMSAGDAVKYAITNRNLNEWVIGAWHDVNLNGFKKRVTQIKDADIKVKTVGEMYNDIQ